MNIFFDMDYTILGLDNSIRPGTEDVMERLIADGHIIYVWSGMGIRWTEVREHKLDKYVTDCFVKPLENFVQAVEKQNLPATVDIVIDDYPEITQALGGIWIRPYLFKNPRDDEMERVYKIITDYAKTGRSDDERFHLGPQQRPHP
ncbi:MAG: hypothetical protein EXR53_03795 [Dehalococcoidia bacterium]|nr:hypothetical protein [Dehalococcoidia bacterium]